MEKRKSFILPRLETGPLGRAARSQSLYRLRYYLNEFEGEFCNDYMKVELLNVANE
jgi:hypothetical protein